MKVELPCLSCIALHNVHTRELPESPICTGSIQPNASSSHPTPIDPATTVESTNQRRKSV